VANIHGKANLAGQPEDLKGGYGIQLLDARKNGDDHLHVRWGGSHGRENLPFVTGLVKLGAHAR